MYLLGTRHILAAADLSNDNQVKIETLKRFDRHPPATAKKLFSQAEKLSLMLPERLQMNREDEGLFVYKASYNLDQLVNQFCQNKNWQAPETARLLAELVVWFDRMTKAAVVRHYRWQRVTMNVSPPAGAAQVTFSGMDPAEIKNPILRKQYEVSIAENSLKNSQNILQAALQEEPRSSKIRARRLLSATNGNKLLSEATNKQLEDIVQP